MIIHHYLRDFNRFSLLLYALLWQFDKAKLSLTVTGEILIKPLDKGGENGIINIRSGKFCSRLKHVIKNRNYRYCHFKS